MGRRRTPEFGEFWDAYGLKRDRIAAERAWKRLPARDRTAAFDGIGAYRDACRRRGIAMMYGQGYLTHRRWEDEQDGTVSHGNAVNGLRAEVVLMDEAAASPTPSDPHEDMEIW